VGLKATRHCGGVKSLLYLLGIQSKIIEGMHSLIIISTAFVFILLNDHKWPKVEFYCPLLT
jgi:hypothetical protein